MYSLFNKAQSFGIAIIKCLLFILINWIVSYHHRIFAWRVVLFMTIKIRTHISEGDGSCLENTDVFCVWFSSRVRVYLGVIIAPLLLETIILESYLTDSRERQLERVVCLNVANYFARKKLVAIRGWIYWHVSPAVISSRASVTPTDTLIR